MYDKEDKQASEGNGEGKEHRGGDYRYETPHPTHWSDGLTLSPNLLLLAQTYQEMELKMKMVSTPLLPLHKTPFHELDSVHESMMNNLFSQVPHANTISQSQGSPDEDSSESNGSQPHKAIPRRSSQLRQPRLSAAKTGKIQTCTCKKTMCLKNYCDCFRDGRECSEECHCSDCHNNTLYQHEREEALMLHSDGGNHSKIEEIGQHPKGCNCQKSGCSKRYCQCYQAGIQCGSNCKCKSCLNDGKEKTARKRRHIQQM